MVNVALTFGGASVVAMGLFTADSAQGQALPPITVSSTLSETDVQRDSATMPAVTVTSGGNYAGTGVTLTSQAPSPGGNIGALSVQDAGHAFLDATSIVRMESSSPAATCCTYGVLVSGSGVVDSAANVTGTTGGAGAYGGGHLNLNGGSMSGQFGVVASGIGSLITGSADIAGAAAGAGVRAELGGEVALAGGRVLSNGMTAVGSASSISTTGTDIQGAVSAYGGASVDLHGGAVAANGWGATAIFADGSNGGAASRVTTSADVKVSGGGGATAVSARNGGVVEITGGNIQGDSNGVSATGQGSKLTVSNAVITQGLSQGSSAVLARSGGTVILDSGTISAPGWNNAAVIAEGAGSIVRNIGAEVRGVGSSSIGARASGGGSYILEAGGAMNSSGTGVQATDAGSTVTSSGVINASGRAVHATAKGKVILESGSLATTENKTAAIVADTQGSIEVESSELLNTAIFAGGGIQAASGGKVNLAGGTLTISGNGSAGLLIDGSGSEINTSAPLSVVAVGSSTKAMSVSNGASETFSNLTAMANGTSGVVVASTAGSNQLEFIGSTLSSAQGSAVLGQSGSLALNLSATALSGPRLIQDTGGTVTIVANDSSSLGGTADALNSSITLNSGSRWEVGGGSSRIGSIAFDSGTMKFLGASNLSTAGDVTLGAAGATIDTNGFEAAVGASTITGVGGLVKTGAGRLVLSSGINYTGNTRVDDGVLQIGDGAEIGAVRLGDVDNNGTLAFNRPDTAVVDTITGSGGVEQNGAGTTVLVRDNFYSGGTTINAGTLQLGNSGYTGSVTGNIVVNGAGTLAIKRGDAVTLSNHLTGSGLVTVDTGGSAFNFASTTGAAFTGTVAIGSSTFDLGGDNAVSLANSTLRADAGSVITVADGRQSIRGLDIDGGKLTFNASAPDQTVATSLIAAGSLDASHSGTIQITVPPHYVPSAPNTPNTTNLLSQDDANVGTKLVDATAVVGTGGALSLVDQGGTAISSARLVDIEQEGNSVAKGTYDYRMSTAPGDGLYVNYGLSQLDVQLGQVLALAQDGSTAGAAADMSARITGSGDLGIHAGTGTISLSNVNNDYSGDTTVASGGLRLDADNALGNTRMLHVASSASADFNGRSQTIGSLDGQVDSALDIHGGTLTIAQGGTSAGQLIGDGQLNLTGGMFNVRGANTALRAKTTIAAGASAQLNEAAGLGSGAIENDGGLVLNGVVGTLSNSIRGTGSVNLAHGSALTVAGDNSTFSGQFNLENGTALTISKPQNLGTAAIANDGKLVVRNTSDWTAANVISGSGEVVKEGLATLTMSGANVYAGATTVTDGTLRAGAANAFSAASAHTVLGGAVLDTGGFDQVVASLNNSGTVSLLGSEPGSTLTVNGGYVGHNSVLRLGTALGDSGSVSDRLLLNGPGANASGKTSIQITNLGGLGALTTGNGINVVIAENGATTTAQTTKDAFVLANEHVDAGAFEYRLYAADENGEGENWYLRSAKTDSAKPDPNVPDPVPTFRAEVPLYTALPSVLRQTDITMLSNLHRRKGDEAKREGTGGDARRLGWARIVGNSMQIEQTSITAPRTDAAVLGLQGGIDAFRSADWNLGLFAGQLRAEAQVGGFYGADRLARRNTGNLRADTTYLGGYATYANQEGQYADFVLQYGRQNVQSNSINGISSDLRGNSATASAEVGQRFPLDETWSIEPQAQLSVNHQSMGDAEISGARVTQDFSVALTGRIGARIIGSYATSIGHLQPYARVNIWHGFGDTETTRFVTPAATTAIASRTGYTSTELAAGFTLNLSPTTSVYGELGSLNHTSSGDSRISSSVQGSFGIKVSF